MEGESEGGEGVGWLHTFALLTRVVITEISCAYEYGLYEMITGASKRINVKKREARMNVPLLLCRL